MPVPCQDNERLPPRAALENGEELTELQAEAEAAAYWRRRHFPSSLYEQLKVAFKGPMVVYDGEVSDDPVRRPFDQ